MEHETDDHGWMNEVVEKRELVCDPIPFAFFALFRIQWAWRIVYNKSLMQHSFGMERRIYSAICHSPLLPFPRCVHDLITCAVCYAACTHEPTHNSYIFSLSLSISFFMVTYEQISDIWMPYRHLCGLYNICIYIFEYMHSHIRCIRTYYSVASCHAR